MLGILAGIGVGVALGLLVVAYLLGTNSRPAATVPSDTSSQSGAPTAQAQPTTGDEPPRMTLADFKAVYDNFAQRPYIIDVRDKDAYATGHIKGAISFPQTDVASRVQELPKDKLIVAYCQ